MSAASTKALALSLGANIGIAVSKYVVFGLTRSASMLTEAIHSTADCGNQMLLFVGLKKAQKAPSEAHPLGYGQASYVASFLVALLLFTVGGLFSLQEGLHKIRHPEHPHDLHWAVGLLLFSIVLESISMWGALKAAKQERGDRPLLRYMRESSSTELVVVLAEDAAALVGLCLALAAVCLTAVTHDPVWDGVGSVSIGLLLIAVAAFVGWEVTSLLLNEAAPAAMRERIRAAVDAHASVESCLNMVAIVVGSDQLMVAMKVRFHETPSGTELARRINDMEKELRVAFPQIRHLFVEPDTEA